MKQTMFNRINRKQSERSYSNQSKLKTVPQKKTTRNYNSEERNVRMNQPPSKSNGKNVVTMNQTSQSYSGYESSKMCLFEPRVFSDTQDIADELKPPCYFSEFTTD